jgi:hypothetical protein
MNERIKELAEQAGFLNKDEESIEYFAELIVRECAQQAHDLADVLSMHRDKAGAEIAESIGNTIKEHFGVEE